MLNKKINEKHYTGNPQHKNLCLKSVMKQGSKSVTITFEPIIKAGEDFAIWYRRYHNGKLKHQRKCQELAVASCGPGFEILGSDISNWPITKLIVKRDCEMWYSNLYCDWPSRRLRAINPIRRRIKSIGHKSLLPTYRPWLDVSLQPVICNSGYIHTMQVYYMYYSKRVKDPNHSKFLNNICY